MYHITGSRKTATINRDTFNSTILLNIGVSSENQKVTWKHLQEPRKSHRLVRGSQNGRENNASIANCTTTAEYANPHYFVNIINYASAASDAKRQLANQRW
jgi:hypothetical protein